MEKVLIVDDHPVVRLAVSVLLKREGLEVVGEAANGIDAISLAKTTKPDLILLDISIPQMDGISVIHHLRQLGLPLRVLVLTSHASSHFMERCRIAGASGFITKTNELEDLSTAIRAIRSGFSFFPQPPVTARNENNYAQIIASLSDREMMVFLYLTKGMSNNAIADELVLSNKTVSTYKTRLMQKLGVSNLVELIEVAQQNGIHD